MTRTAPLLWLGSAAILASCANPERILDQAGSQQAASFSTAAAIPDLGGAWAYDETSILVLKPGDEVLRLTCRSSEGVLTIVQDGANFTGTLTHPSSICTTAGGQVVPAPWPLPYEATISGRITGRAFLIDQVDPGTTCVKQGRVLGSGATAQLATTGRCDLSFVPFRPATAHNSAVASRP